ncbi:Ku protein [Herbaspirillum frisingense]|uniref:Ku protein n=1 Tax=Herbaspirillum frisingense TaxID=92645 RepID=UPI0030B854EA
MASDKMAIAQIVIRTRQHLAALIPQGDMLQLITLRYPSELRAPDDLPVPSRKSRKAAVTRQEVEMARALVDHMSAEWEPEQFHDTYRDDVLGLIKKKIKSRQTHEVAEPDEAAAPASSGAKVVDLMALLKSSLDGRGKASAKARKSIGDDADEEEGKPLDKPTQGAKVHKLPDRKPAAKRSSTRNGAKPAPRAKAAAGAKNGSKSSKTSKSAKNSGTSRRAQA